MSSSMATLYEWNTSKESCSVQDAFPVTLLSGSTKAQREVVESLMMLAVRGSVSTGSRMLVCAEKEEKNNGGEEGELLDIEDDDE